MYIWAVGLLAAGQSSTMTGTYSGQFVMEVRPRTVLHLLDMFVESVRVLTSVLKIHRDSWI